MSVLLRRPVQTCSGILLSATLLAGGAAPAALTASADTAQHPADSSASLATSDAHLRQNADGTVTVALPASTRAAALDRPHDTYRAAAVWSGWTVEFHSWGAVLRLQKPYADKLVRLLRTGASAAAVASLFPSLAGSATALSAVLSLGATVIENCTDPSESIST